MDRKEHECLQVYGPCLLSVGAGMMWNDSVAKATGWKDDPRHWPPSLSDCLPLAPACQRPPAHAGAKPHALPLKIASGRLECHFHRRLSRLSGFAKLMILRKVSLRGFKYVDLEFKILCLSFRCFCEFGGTLQDRIFWVTGFLSCVPFALSFPSQAWNWCWSALDFGKDSCSFLWQWQCAHVPVDVQSWYRVSNSASFTLKLSLTYRRFVWYHYNMVYIAGIQLDGVCVGTAHI